jgi:hypothetical protein
MDDGHTDKRALLNGQVALVVGGAQGIGKAIAVRLGREGARVVIADMDSPMMKVAVREMCTEGTDAKPVQCDVRDSAQVESDGQAGAELVQSYRHSDVRRRHSPPRCRSWSSTKQPGTTLWTPTCEGRS